MCKMSIDLHCALGSIGITSKFISGHICDARFREG